MMVCSVKSLLEHQSNRNLLEQFFSLSIVRHASTQLRKPATRGMASQHLRTFERAVPQNSWDQLVPQGMWGLLVPQGLLDWHIFHNLAS